MIHDRSPRRVKMLPVIILAAAMLLVPAACAPGIVLHTRPDQSAGLREGTYTLFLYGCSNPQSIENTVILAPEGGKHPLAVYGPEFEYKIKQGVPAKEALAEADRFLRCSVYYRKTQLRDVLDRTGGVIGYELRPLYSIVDFGVEDVLLVDYRQMQDNRVVVYINLDPRVDRRINEEREPLIEHGDGHGK